ncbi:MAG: O-linked GlcNAc transferase-TPR-containing transrane protein [Bacteroidota bacterium]|nr:O-linked GlcNAc transferase-TPR-containing transrane protein [Bacteroidota bacterium]
MKKQKKQVLKKTVAVVQKKAATAKYWNVFESWLGKNTRYVLGGLLLAATILRIIYFVQLNNTPCINWHLATESDMNFFDKWAKHLANEDWLQHTSYNNYTQAHKWVAEDYLKKHPETIEELKKELPAGSEINFNEYGKLLFKSWQGDKVYFQEPFYAYLVAIFYKIFGPDVRYVFIFQMLMGLCSIALIFLITRNYFGNIAALVSGLLALLHGPLLFYELILLRESLIVFIGLLLVFSISETLKNKSRRNLFFSGFIIGISILIKSVFFIFGVLFLILIFVDARRKKEGGGNSMLLPAAGIIAGLLPLIIRNIIVGVSPFAISSSGAFSFMTCNYYHYNPIQAFTVNSSNADVFYKTKGAFLQSVVETLKTFPSFSEYLNLLWQKLKLIFLWTEIPNNKSFYYYKINAPVLGFTFINFSVIAALGIPGIVMSFYKKQKPISLYLLVLTHFGVLLGFLVLSRYRIPFTAGLIPFCGLAVSELIKKAETKSFNIILITVPVIVIFFIVNRSIPDGLFPIRTTDYASPYYFYYKPRIDSLMKKNQPELARKEMEKFLKITPPELESLQGNMMQASADEINLAQFYGQIYNHYSTLFFASNMYDRGSEARKRSEELTAIADRLGNAMDAFSLFKKARMTSDTSERKQYLQQAVNELQLRLKANPNDFDALGAMSDITLDDLHDTAQFEHYIKAALKVQPDNARAQFKLGNYYIMTNKNLDEGKRLIESSQKDWSDNSAAYTDLGYYYAVHNQNDKALQLWQTAVKMNPADCTAVNDLRILRKRMNN